MWLLMIYSYTHFQGSKLWRNNGGAGMPENPSVWMWHSTAQCWHQLANCPARWPGDAAETRRRLSGLQCGWLCARCPSFLSHHNRALSDPVVPGLVVSTLQDHTTPSGPLPERSNAELQRNGNPRSRGEAGRKGIPPHLPHTHTKGIVTFFKTLEINYFPCAFLKPAYWVSLRLCWPTVTAKYKEEEKPSDRAIQAAAPCKGSRLSPRRKVLEDFLITMAISR